MPEADTLWERHLCGASPFFCADACPRVAAARRAMVALRPLYGPSTAFH